MRSKHKLGTEQEPKRSKQLISS